MNKQPENIITIDKTSLYNLKLLQKQIAPKGKSHPRRLHPSLGTVDIVYSFLRGDGEHPFFYVETTNPPAFFHNFPPSKGKIVVLPKKTNRRGEVGFSLFLDYLIE